MKEVFKKKLRDRLSRVIEMIDRDAPQIIIVNEFFLALEAIIGFAPKQMFDHFREMIFRKVLSRAGFCENCAKDMRDDPAYRNTWTWCPECDAELQKIAAEAESEEDLNANC